MLLYFKEKLKLAIASSSKNAKLILAKLKITKLFDDIDGNDIKEAKPNPEIFISPTKPFIKTDECVVIEDATWD